jgi:TIR domain
MPVRQRNRPADSNIYLSDRSGGMAKRRRPLTAPDESVPAALSDRQRQYDVCLSFAGEDRAYVEKVASSLKRSRVAVFYDRYEQADLWGKDLYTHLDSVYRLSAKFCLIFISKSYAKKLWTNHERRSAQARAFLENDEYILPVRMDSSEVPGLLPTVGYIDATLVSPSELAKLVVEKLKTLQSNARLPHTVNSEFQRILYDGFDYQGFTHRQILAVTKGRWLVGRRGMWQGKMANNMYILTNRTTLAATLNNHLTFRDDNGQLANLGEGKVSVRVRLLPPFSENTSAGLLFRGSAAAMTYYAFYRKPGRAFSLCQVVSGKLETIWVSEVPELDDSEFCRLSVSGTRDRVELSIDSSLVFTYSNASINGPAVGTSVLGTGVFEFDDFSMYTRKI